METRKAQLSGGSTFTVSLPKDWATEIGLETGDPLRLYPRKRALLVEPLGEDDYWETTVDVEGHSETQVRRTIQALYTTGFDRIAITSPTGMRDDRAAIGSTARKLIGLETVDLTDTQVTLRSLLDPATVSVEQSAVQIQQVALSMHEDAVTALLERDRALAEQVLERDDQVDRLYAMISRHFQRSLVSPRETSDLELSQVTLYEYRTAARQLERVADHAEKIATLGTQLENSVPTDFADGIATAAATARRIVELAASTITGDAEIDAAHTALDRRDELARELQDLEQDLHGRTIPDGHLIALTLDSLRRTAEYGGNIAETALQAAARERRL